MNTEDKIWNGIEMFSLFSGLLLGVIVGGIVGFTSAGIGGLIVGLIVGVIVGALMAYALHWIILLAIYVGLPLLILGIIVGGSIYLIAKLWGVGKP